MIDYSTLAAVYDEKYTSEMSIRENEAVKELLERYEVWNWNVLDVGCGTGFALDCVSIPRYLGIDASEEMIKAAIRKYPRNDFVAAKFQDVDLPLERFEVVLCLFSIPYIGVEAVERIHKALVKNGVCICVFYNKPYLNADSVYFGREEEFNNDVLPCVKTVLEAFKSRFNTIEHYNLTEDGTYTVKVFRKEKL